MSLFCDHAPALFDFVSVSSSSRNVNRCRPPEQASRFSSFAIDMLAGTMRISAFGSCGCSLAFFARFKASLYSFSFARSCTSYSRTDFIHSSTSFLVNDLPLACGASTTVMKFGACSSPSRYSALRPLISVPITGSRAITVGTLKSSGAASVNSLKIGGSA